MTFTFADSTEWWLEIPPDVQADAWQQSQISGTPNRRWIAYLHQLCLNTFLPWLQSEIAPMAQLEFQVDLPALWELVNGIVIRLDRSTRMVLLPEETIDNAELEVPQEWVDIPSWTVEYYVAVQVKLGQQLERNWLRVWGYTTHHNLKNQGNYDLGQRMYYLDKQSLIQDMNSLWVSYDLCSESPAKVEIVPLSELPAAQAEQLMQRLSNPSITFPRLAVPFAMWGALLQQATWRSQLCQQRQAMAPISLRQWLENQLENIMAGWQSLETRFDSTSLAWNFRDTVETGESEVTRIKQINWATETDIPPVLLVVGLKAEADERLRVLVQIYSSQTSNFVPSNLILRLCSETGDVLQLVQAREQDIYIQLQFRCTSSTRFNLQISLNDDSFVEAFIV